MLVNIPIAGLLTLLTFGLPALNLPIGQVNSFHAKRQLWNLGSSFAPLRGTLLDEINRQKAKYAQGCPAGTLCQYQSTTTTDGTPAIAKAQAGNPLTGNQAGSLFSNANSVRPPGSQVLNADASAVSPMSVAVAPDNAAGDDSSAENMMGG